MIDRRTKRQARHNLLTWTWFGVLVCIVGSRLAGLR